MFQPTPITLLTSALLLTSTLAAPSSRIIRTASGHYNRLRPRAPSAGCGLKPDIGDGGSKDYTTVAGRDYKVHLPRDYSENNAAPLIFSYHGAGGSVDQQADLDRLADTEFNTDHIVVYLQGNADDPAQPDRTTWEGAPENHSDDVSFTRDVLNAVVAAYCVDESRVYATGFSQGGGFIGAQLACTTDLSTRFAAYAPVSGAYYQKQVDQEGDCVPETVGIDCAAISSGAAEAGAEAGAEVGAEMLNTPIMAFHGGSDDTIRYEGGFRNGACLPAVRHFVDTWVAANGLDSTPANETIEGTSVAMQYSSDGADPLVTLVYAGDEVGHAWMSTATGTATFEASQWIMAFFRSRSLP